MSCDPTAGGACGNGGGSSGFNGAGSKSSVLSNPTGTGFGSWCGNNNTLVPYSQNYNDPLGPNARGQEAPSGGPEMRSGIYSTLQSLYPGMADSTNQSVKALQDAAANPGYADASRLATDTIDGKYLNGSPQLDAAMAQMRGASQRSVADSGAQLASTFARNGMSYGTPQQEAQDANAAAANASANNTEAQARLANYTTERANQNNGVNMLNSATGAPVNYLSQVNAAQLSPLSSVAQIVSGLSGGSTTSYQPQDIVSNPSVASSLSSNIGSL